MYVLCTFSAETGVVNGKSYHRGKKDSRVCDTGSDSCWTTAETGSGRASAAGKGQRAATAATRWQCWRRGWGSRCWTIWDSGEHGRLEMFSAFVLVCMCVFSEGLFWVYACVKEQYSFIRIICVCVLVHVHTHMCNTLANESKLFKLKNLIVSTSTYITLLIAVLHAFTCGVHLQNALGQRNAFFLLVFYNVSMYLLFFTSLRADAFSTQLSGHDRQLTVHDIRMAEMDLRFQLLETASYDGTLVWKIRDYERRKRDAVNGRTLSLYSQPFYTGRFGYKMCARVYLNGDGMGKTTHMSLFFVVMRGMLECVSNVYWSVVTPLELSF